MYCCGRAKMQCDIRGLYCQGTGIYSATSGGFIVKVGGYTVSHQGIVTVGQCRERYCYLRGKRSVTPGGY